MINDVHSLIVDYDYYYYYYHILDLDSFTELVDSNGLSLNQLANTLGEVMTKPNIIHGITESYER